MFSGMTRVPLAYVQFRFRMGLHLGLFARAVCFIWGTRLMKRLLRGETQTKLLEKCDYPKGTFVGIWAEGKVKYTNEEDDTDTSAFDYSLIM